MKKILFLIIVSISFTLFSQTDCNNNVSTDFNNPTNNSLPDYNGTYYLNGFNWLAKNGQNYANYQLDNMSSNFYNFYEMQNIMSSSHSEYDYLQKTVLPLINNGWELLGVNLGRYPNDTTVLETIDLRYLPYIYLYNRYSGVVRVFVKFRGYGQSILEDKFLLVQMRYYEGSYKSGILRYNNGYDQALDQYITTTSINSIAYSPTGDTEWTSTDFKIAYDPCVCFKPSFVNFNFYRINKSDLQVVNGIYSDPIIDSTLNKISTRFLTGFNDSKHNKNGGVLMYKSVFNLVSDYQANYESQNKKLVENSIHSKKLKRNLALLNLIKACVLEVENDISISTLDLTQNVKNKAITEAANYDDDKKLEYFKNITPESNIATENWYNIVKNLKNGLIVQDNTGQEILNEVEILKTLKTILSENSLLFSCMNFNLREIDSLNTLPVIATNYLNFLGDKMVPSTSSVASSLIYTPGVFKSYGFIENGLSLTGVYQYPTYNESVGVFAMLNSPKIRIAHQVIDKENTLIQNSHIGGGGIFNNSNGYISTQRHQSWSNSYQIQLGEDLIYAINDVLDIDKYSIKCAYHIKVIPKKINVPKHVKINTFIDSVNTVNVESSNLNISKYTPILSFGNEFNTFQNSFDTIGFYGAGSNERIQVDEIDFETPFIPINAFKPFTVELSLKNEIITKNEQIINHDDLDNYSYTQSSNCNNCVNFDLSNSLINLPAEYKPNEVGYGFEFEIELKLMVDVDINTINSNNKQNSTTRLLTFKVTHDKIILSNDSYVDNLNSSSKNITKFPENLYLKSTYFNGQEIEGCTLSGNTYTCSAYNNILVGGDLTTANGYSVNLNAGDSVKFINQSNYSSSVNLNHHSILDYSQPLGLQTQSYVNNYCLYKYRAMHSPVYFNDPQSNPKKDTINNVLDFDLFPNPASQSVSIVFEDNYVGTVNILVSDLVGKQQNVLVSKRYDGNLSLDISNLSTGVYLVSIYADEQVKTKRLVVTNRKF